MLNPDFLSQPAAFVRRSSHSTHDEHSESSCSCLLPLSCGAMAAAAADPQMVLLETAPANPVHSLAFQLKQLLGLATTPLVQKHGAGAIAFMASAEDGTKATAAGQVVIFGVTCALLPYEDDALAAVMASVRSVAAFLSLYSRLSCPRRRRLRCNQSASRVWGLLPSCRYSRHCTGGDGRVVGTREQPPATTTPPRALWLHPGVYKGRIAFHPALCGHCRLVPPPEKAGGRVGTVRAHGAGWELGRKSGARRVFHAVSTALHSVTQIDTLITHASRERVPCPPPAPLPCSLGR